MKRPLFGELCPNGQPQFTMTVLALINSNSRIAVGDEFDSINRHLLAAPAVGQLSAIGFQQTLEN